jgi:DNA-binding transcriptional regulator YdaS (Cro superfamily)
VVDVRRAGAKRADKEMAKVLAVKRAVVKQVVVNAVMGPAVTGPAVTGQVVTGQVVTGQVAAMAGDRVGLVAETVAWWVALPGGLESPVEVPGERLKSGRQPISSP